VGGLGGDSVRLTAIDLKIAVDTNRDGEIVFAGETSDPKKVDATTPDKPFRFWCNEDQDVRLADGSEDDIESSEKDSDDKFIDSKRDLEDFARIWMQITPALEGTTAELSWRNVQGNPAVNIFTAFELDGGTKYLTDDEIADNQRLSFATAKVSNGSPYQFDPGFFSDGKTKYFIFEGAGVGKGELVLQLKKDGQVIAESSVHLDLKSIKDMYERATLDDGTLEPLPLAQELNTVAQDPDESKHIILFIHGWNNTEPGWLSTSETLLKRLWWQGYRGRVATIKWPCDLQLQLFNRSEFKAFKSGLGTSRYFNKLKSRFPDYSLNVFAHSQGTVVLGEALNEQVEGGFRAVSNVVLTQGAIPAHCYNKDAAFYQDFLTKEVSTPTPEKYRDRFGVVSGVLSGRLTNLYNAEDFALVTGAWPDESGIDTNWEQNQILLKPDWYRGYSTDGVKGFNSLGTEVTDVRELIAMVSRSRSKAVGAMSATGGTVFESINIGKDTAYDFQDTRPDHSGQFARGIQVLDAYYKTLLEKFQIVPNP
jgi:hypothetical protein